MNSPLPMALALFAVGACAGEDDPTPRVSWPADAVAVTGITLIGPDGARPNVSLVLSEGRVFDVVGAEDAPLPAWMPREDRAG